MYEFNDTPDEATGFILPSDGKIEKEELMTRAQWKAYFYQEVITEEQYLLEQREWRRTAAGVL